MNLLREEFCKETNTPMGLDNIYNYVEWLENKWQQERSYSEEDLRNAFFSFPDEWICFEEWFEQFKKK